MNDAADYVVIRDDWLWSRSLSVATSEKERIACVISLKYSAED